MLEVEGLKKNYGGYAALKGISFRVNKGEIVGFLGPNGAGKTTTMKILTNFIYPSSGSVKIDCGDIFLHPEKFRRRIGYLSENNPLYEEMMVYSYLSFVCDIRGISPKRDAIHRVISITGLKDVADRLIGDLSKGFRQRVGIAQALIHDPELLILDEPTSGLDPNQIADIRQVLKKIGEDKTVLLSTHILSEVEQTCRRAIIIDDGKIVADNRIEALRDSSMDQNRVELTAKGIESEQQITQIYGRFGRIEDIRSNGGEYSFKIIQAKGRDDREQIFRASAERGIVLIELHMESSSLENLFRRLTAGEGGQGI